MIGFLRGRVLHSSPDHVLLDVSGVGYSVHIPVSTYSVIERARSDEPIELFIRTHVREDALDLYGFATEAEKQKDWFAAAWHLNQLVTRDPQNTVLKERLEKARAALNASQPKP